MSAPRLKTRPDSVLEDPGALSVAGLYARSYLTAAQQNGISDPQDEVNSLLDDVLVTYPDFAELLMSDVISKDDKLAIVERVIAPHSTAFF